MKCKSCVHREICKHKEEYKELVDSYKSDTFEIICKKYSNGEVYHKLTPCILPSQYDWLKPLQTIPTKKYYEQYWITICSSNLNVDGD